MTARARSSRLRNYYDANAARQDTQGWYEDAALEKLTLAADFANAKHIVETGCGTGRYARKVLGSHVPETARYTGIDFSSAMLALARQKLSSFAERVNLIEADVTQGVPLETACCDRFVATYLFDLLTQDQMDALLGEARRILSSGGLLCIAGLTSETHGGVPGLVTGLWALTARVWPRRVGGCRPVSLAPQLDPSCWRIAFRETIVAYGVSSEVLVARKP